MKKILTCSFAALLTVATVVGAAEKPVVAKSEVKAATSAPVKKSDEKAGSTASAQPEVPTHTEPFPARVTGTVPQGWEITVMENEEITHGPYELANGQKVSFTTPAYQLTPIVLEGGVYLIEPGFNPDKANPREGTLCEVLAKEMESLRLTGERLKAISAEVRQLRDTIDGESRKRASR